MSSYQTVSLTNVDGRRLTMEVEEFNPDQDVLSRLVEGGVIKADHEHDARKFVAMMLCEYNDYENAITADATETNCWGQDGNEAVGVIVQDVSVTSLEEIGRSNSDAPRYKASLVVTLVNEHHARSLKPGTWDTAADPNGDLEDYFG